MYPGIHAQRAPQRPAAIAAETGEVLTYAELEERSIRLARVLAGVGLRPGSNVAFLSDNDLEVFVVYLAALRSGLYVTGINHHLTAGDVAYILRDCGAGALIASGRKGDLAGEAVEGLGDVSLRLAFGGSIDGFDSYRDALATVSADPLDDEPRGADMLYSSGTTGRPKGIKPPLSGRQLSDGDLYAMLFGPLYGFDEDTTYYSAAPVYHAAPLRFGGVIQSLGGTVVMASRFDAEAALGHIERYRVTHSQWVPTMFVRMLKLEPAVRERHDLSSLRSAIHAAAPCPIEVKRQMIDWWGPILHEYYSSTEGNGITFITSAEWLERPGSVGRAGLGTIHVCGPGGEELPAGEIGLVYFAREAVTFEYHNDRDKTRAGQHPQNPSWSTTGDVGYLDDGGYLFLTGRQGFMIISGGVNIYPQEIEDCLALHPDVLDVAVIGVPDEEMGEQVKAVVEVGPGATAGPDVAASIIAFARERLAHYKVPRSVDFIDVLPRSAAGKMVKTDLVRRYAAAAAAGSGQRPHP